ncbi:MAG TPA: 5-dehydro-2-deoxygluconokinase [Acidimicrobiales bacterium]|nr:5-dehydro-2-deoxygluconokinase [Acidimicrobiales bacterium]
MTIETAVIDTTAIDLLCAGRSCVDLYGEQDGAPLRGVQSFAKYVGGSATNVCVGAARLGLRTAMCTRVGDEDLGRFVLDTLRAEGVDTSLVQLDPERPTGLVTLAVRKCDDFPRIFFYRDSADLALDAAAVDLELVARCRAVLLTGSYLVNDALAGISRMLAETVRGAGGRVILDLDYRPVLWGLAPVGRGNDMSSAAARVVEAYGSLLGLCDLVVGTGEEIVAAGGSGDLRTALEALRAETDATIVAKRGAGGAVVFEGPIPTDLSAGISAPGYAVEVRNSVGAGDAFMSGFLSGFLRDRPLAECVRLGNASGAIVVTRHGCLPAMPVAEERDRFVALGGVTRPDDDATIERLHRVGTRSATPERLCVLAIDHRWQLEELADACGAGRDRLPPLKRLLGEAFFEVAAGRADVGILVDDQYGYDVLEAVDGCGAFVARAMDVSRSRPLELLVGEEIQAGLRSWPPDQVVKVMVYAHLADPAELTRLQLERLERLGRACRALGRELLVELQVPKGRVYGGKDLPELLARCYEGGIRPEWWKLPPSDDGALWRQLGDVVRAEDPSCRGLLVLGSTSTSAELESALAAASGEPLCRGFAVGRAIYARAAERWLRREVDDGALVAAVVGSYREMIALWERVAAAAGRALGD